MNTTVTGQLGSAGETFSVEAFCISADRTSSLAPGIVDNVQVYNLPKFDGFHHREQPAILQDNIKEIEEFSRVSSGSLDSENIH